MILTVVGDGAKPPTLEEAQALVGGYVELLRLPCGSQLLVNEDGRCLGLGENKAASMLARQVIVGNAVLLHGTARWR